MGRKRLPSFWPDLHSLKPGRPQRDPDLARPLPSRSSPILCQSSGRTAGTTVLLQVARQQLGKVVPLPLSPPQLPETFMHLCGPPLAWPAGRLCSTGHTRTQLAELLRAQPTSLCPCSLS